MTLATGFFVTFAKVLGTKRCRRRLRTEVAWSMLGVSGVSGSFCPSGVKTIMTKAMADAKASRFMPLPVTWRLLRGDVSLASLSTGPSATTGSA